MCIFCWSCFHVTNPWYPPVRLDLKLYFQQMGPMKEYFVIVLLWMNLTWFNRTSLSPQYLQWSHHFSRSPASLRSPRWRDCWFSAVEWRTSTLQMCTWSGPGMTERRLALSHTLDLSLTIIASTASGVRSNLSWRKRTRELSTPAVFTTPASLLQATKMSCTTLIHKVTAPSFILVPLNDHLE